jgi:hypothetical protein
MPVDRRSVLAGGALIALAGAVSTKAEAAPDVSTATTKTLRKSAIFVPGYYPEYAFANGKPVTANRRMTRAIKDHKGVAKMLTRIGLDGSVRQTLLPVAAHDVEVSPDGSVGILCGFEADGHCAFDPRTLEMVAVAPSWREGWRGGGHAVYLDGGKTLIVSERAPVQPATGGLEHLYGRLTIRDPETLKIAESYSTYGVDPHDIRLIEDGKYIVAANYGSVVSTKTGQHTVPRTVAEAAITVIETASGKLVDKRTTGARDTELRHLAAGSLDRIFAIQVRYGSDREDSRQHAGEDAAYEYDRTTEPGLNYMGAATLKYDARAKRLTKMGDAASRKLMRHGLSIKYDERHDQAIASFPSSHQLMVFDGASGDIARRIDTQRLGLRYPCGITLLPDGQHYAVAGYWENLFVFERGSHRLVRELCQYPMFFGHSHITAV